MGYTINPDLQVFVSVSVDGRSDMPVVVGPGVRWRIAEYLMLSLMMPRPQIQFHPKELLMLHVGDPRLAADSRLRTAVALRKSEGWGW